MRSAERRAALLALTVALLGCKGGGEAPKPSPLLAPTHYLGEPFALGAAQCSLLSATPMLTEAVALAPESGVAQAEPGQGSVAEDLSVVALHFACEDAHGAALPFSRLPARLSWVDRARTPQPPSGRTAVSRKHPEHVVFEVPSGQDGLPRTRRYDARSGEPLARHEAGSARLYLDPLDDKGYARSRVVVAPWPRLHDAGLDALLDRLARALIDEAGDKGLGENEASSAALTAGRKLYQRAREHFAPKVLAFGPVAVVEGQPRLTLSVEAGARGREVLASADFSLEFSPDPEGRPTLVRVLDPEGARAALECAIQREDLRANLERAQLEAARQARDNGTPEVHCNALGVLVPHACTLAESRLLQTALRVQTRCGPSGALGLDLHESSSAPSDFEVKLRRGRSSDGLDGEPRYSLSLARSGQVRFEGLQHVNLAAPGEGRTSQALLAALWGHLLRVGWLERDFDDDKRCVEGERGDVISVVANGHTRTVRDRAGCRAGFASDELGALRRVIEHVGALDGWTRRSLPVFARDAEIWVVAAE